MKKIFLALCLITSSLFAAQGGWTISSANTVKVPAPVNTIATWTSITPPNTNQWNSVCYGNGTFVAVASSGTGNRVLTSSDGITWTARTSAADNEWYSVCFGNGLFVAVSITGTGDRVMTSPDGITWTSRTSAEDNNWYGVCYGYDTSGRGLFVAVAQTGTNRVMTSYDGITWTARSAGAANQWSSVCYGNSLFVAISNSGTSNRVMTSPDGITWTAQTSAADNNWYGVCYGNGLYVAVAYSGSGTRVMTSSDGASWATQTSSSDSTWYAVVYANGVYAAIGSGTAYVMYSTNGTSWSQTAYPAGGANAITYGNGLLVGVATNKICYSGTLNTSTTQMNTPSTITTTTGATVAKIDTNPQPAFSTANMDGANLVIQTPSGNGATNKGGDIRLFPGAAASTGYPGNVYFDNNPWDDTQQSAIALKDAGANIPALTQYGTSAMYFPLYEIDDAQYFSLQLPHGYKQGSAITLHVHWFGSTTDATNAVRWEVTYQWVNIGGTFSTSAATPVTADDTATAGVSKVKSFTASTGTAKEISSHICGRIRRITNGATDYAGDTYLVFLDAHFQRDTIGSRKESSK